MALCYYSGRYRLDAIRLAANDWWTLLPVNVPDIITTAVAIHCAGPGGIDLT